MNNIVITDNKEEMIKIGKEIMESKPNVYTEKICAEIMKTINENMPNTTDEEKIQVMYRSIYYYWVYGFNIYEVFCHDIENKNHEERNTYITCKNRLVYMDYLNKKEDAYLLDDKYEAYKLLKPYYKRDVIQIESEADYDAFIAFVEKHPVFVAKPAGLGLAIGVHKVDSGEYDDKKILFNELLAEGGSAKENYVWGASSAVVLEQIIEQHEGLAKIHPQSVNGIRVTTVRIGDKVHIYYPWFKIGANGNFVTSAAQGTMDACIDAETGVVCTDGFKENRECLEYHPQTGVKIKGYQIPQWDELIKFAKELAMQLDTLNYVGWDLVLTPDNGWCVMEGNSRGEFMWQMCYDKGMKKEFEELIGWKPETDFWWQKA